jgi:hypothetical protein
VCCFSCRTASTELICAISSRRQACSLSEMTVSTSSRKTCQRRLARFRRPRSTRVRFLLPVRERGLIHCSSTFSQDGLQRQVRWSGWSEDDELAYVNYHNGTGGSYAFTTIVTLIYCDCACYTDGAHALVSNIVYSIDQRLYNEPGLDVILFPSCYSTFKLLSP